ncbi:MAG: methylated-DNA--[protein]-cysteine S-methyltransferase [Bacillota bacterium]|nr:methylated-DNA--[protein]-cysteine S-methyltransferase [Bacillota bacterium]
MIYYSNYQSPLGPMLMTSDGSFLLGLDFVEEKNYSKDLKGMEENKDLPVFLQTRTWLDQYFSGQRPDFTPAIKFIGTDFRKKIWTKLLEIPYGSTISYGQISQDLYGKKSHSQAVGGAVGSNPISIIVPCHRVLGADSSLTGYAGGLDRKEFLLNLEKIAYKK